MGNDADPRAVLRRVGLVAIFVGSLDVLSMIYAVAHGMSYESSLNIFAIIAGILLYRGSVNTAKTCANSCALLLGMAAGVIVLVPLFLIALFPLDFLVAVATRDPSRSDTSLAFSLLEAGIFVALLAYVNGALTTGVVTSVYGDTSPRPYRRSWWSVAGIILATVVVVTTGMFLSRLFQSEQAHRAVQKAQAQLGAASASYAFQVTNLHITRDDSGTTIDARVVAYNSKDIRHLEVEWDE